MGDFYSTLAAESRPVEPAVFARPAFYAEKRERADDARHSYEPRPGFYAVPPRLPDTRPERHGGG